MTPKELAELLAGNAEAVARHLLPHGRREGQEWRVGSVQGEAGQSLGIHLSGDKAGIWADFSTDQKGDLVDLWTMVKGISLSQAMKEAREFMGLQERKFAGHQPKQYKSPVVPKCKAVQADSPVYKYLTEERRLFPETLSAFKVAEAAREVIFPYMRDGAPVMVKRLELDRSPEGKKDIRPTSKGQEPCLFGWQAVPANARSVVLTEGEIDAMSWHQFGYPALSVPFGGGKGAKQQWVENEFERLERFDQVYLSMDMDPAGEGAVAELVERLGRHRCRVVALPFKDANECLKREIPAAEMAEFLSAAQTLDPEELRPAADFEDEVVAEFYPPPGQPIGTFTPWSKVGSRFLLRPGEVTVLAGVNGHGKSEGAGHIALDAMRQGERVCIASMEFKPSRWLARLTRQAAGVREPSIPFIRAIAEWYRDKLWVFDIVGRAKADHILETFRYARQRYDIRFFLIDNLSKLDIALDDYDGQRVFVDQLTDFAKEFDVHIILVAHARKGQDDHAPIDKFDVKGGGAITDLPDNVLIWWRNRTKEDSIRKAGDQVPNEIREKPDAICRCVKQRNGEEEPVIALWFDHDSHQFLERQKDRPYRYVEFSCSPIRHISNQ